MYCCGCSQNFEVLDVRPAKNADTQAVQAFGVCFYCYVIGNTLFSFVSFFGVLYCRYGSISSVGTAARTGRTRSSKQSTPYAQWFRGMTDDRRCTVSKIQNSIAHFVAKNLARSVPRRVKVRHNIFSWDQLEYSTFASE